MTKVIKAGCILINFSDKKAGLIYRTKQNDYSFPKGHVEEGETVMECAIRETKEELGIDNEENILDRMVTWKNNQL